MDEDSSGRIRLHGRGWKESIFSSKEEIPACMFLCKMPQVHLRMPSRASIEGKWLHMETALAGHDFPLRKRRRSLSPAAAALPNSLLCQRRLFAWLRRQGNAIAAKEEYRPLRPSAWIRKRNMVRSKKRAQHSGERNMDATFEVPSVSVEVYTSSVRHAPALHRGGQVQDRHEQSKQRVKGIQGSRRANFVEFVCECFADTA